MTEITDLSVTDSSNTEVTGESLAGSIANMGRMDNTLQAVMGLLARSIRTNVLRFLDNADPTKKIALDLTGLPTATTRTWTAPYYSGTLGLVSDIRGQIYGLTLSNNVTDPTNDIDFQAGTAVDSAGIASILLGAGITKRADATWVAGTNQGGRFYTTLANGTLHCYLIRNPTTGVVDAGFSDNESNPTGGASYPSGFTQYRRVGSVLRVAGSIYGFTQYGDTFLFKTPTTDVNTTTQGTAEVFYTLSTPMGVITEALISGYVSNASATVGVLLSSLGQTNPSVGPAYTGIIQIAGQPIVFNQRIFTSFQSLIRGRATAANSSILISTTGYVDTRGRT